MAEARPLRRRMKPADNPIFFRDGDVSVFALSCSESKSINTGDVNLSQIMVLAFHVEGNQRLTGPSGRETREDPYNVTLIGFHIMQLDMGLRAIRLNLIPPGGCRIHVCIELKRDVDHDYRYLPGHTAIRCKK